jgi:hypothetical protein
MKKPFDILWFGKDGPTWIEAVDTVGTAKAHIEKLPPVTQFLINERATVFCSRQNSKNPSRCYMQGRSNEGSRDRG